MPNYDIETIKSTLSSLHEGDIAQLNVIFSENPRMMVEAPAGYGKTTTMISRIAYLFATGAIKSPKKMLALTFSVNAALKIKRDVASKLPSLLGEHNNPNYISEKTTTTNYHGFCKSILKKYGYLLSEHLRKIDFLLALSDYEVLNNTEISILFNSQENEIISTMEKNIKASKKISNELILEYLNIVTTKLLPLNKITYNAIILYVIHLFEKYTECKKFFQKFYSLIVIDEFQDTNIIAWKIIDSLITDNTKLLFMGDSLQRIFGFIGAYPNIMARCVDKYRMELIHLEKNYRFRNNPEMLKLDNNIRQNAINFNNPAVIEDAKIPFMFYKTQEAEATAIATAVNRTLSQNPTEKITILVRNRGVNTNIIEKALHDNCINYFYGLFNDEDEDYVEFHKTCLIEFMNSLNNRASITKNSLEIFVKRIENYYNKSSIKSVKSLIALLYALIKKISIDYINISSDDKKQFLMDVFENRQLKQAMEYIDESVILCTVHGSKGLEWDHVFLSDVEGYITPSFSACRNCANQDRSTANICKLTAPLNTEFNQLFIEELCVFYVAVTRARKQIYVSASTERFNANGVKHASHASCLLFLKGIKPYKFS